MFDHRSASVVQQSCPIGGDRQLVVELVELDAHGKIGVVAVGGHTL